MTQNGAINLPPLTEASTVRLSTGLSLWQGQISEEYLAVLKPWSKAAKVYQEMGDDAVIGALLESIKTPLLASNFEVVAGGSTPADQDLKSFIEQNLFEMPQTEWLGHVEDGLEFLDFGFALSEKVVEKRSDGRLWLKDLVPIGQETLSSWGPTDEFGRVTSFNQRTGFKAEVSAPITKLVHFVFRGRKRDPQGRSLLRSLYRPWFFKKNLETIEAIGVERDVGNAPVVQLDSNRRYTSAEIDALEKALEGFRMDEALYVILPPGSKLEAYGGGNKVYNVREIIRDWQHLIRQRFFADFLSLGSEQVGTQALAREMTTFFGLALRGVQSLMLQSWNRQLIRWLVALNKPLFPEAATPKLEWLRPSDQNVQSLAQAYQSLIEAGLIRKDATVEARIRQQLGLPVVGDGMGGNGGGGDNNGGGSNNGG